MNGCNAFAFYALRDFRIREFSRKLPVKPAYPRVRRKESYHEGKLRSDLHAVDPYGPFPLSFPTPLSFEESSRSYLNSPSTLSRVRFALFSFLLAALDSALLPSSLFLSFSLDRQGKFIVDLNRVLPFRLRATANREMLFPLCRR